MARGPGIDRFTFGRLHRELFEQARVRSLEAHDGLIYVAYHQHRDARVVEASEQGELQGVSVLKFVDHQAINALAQGVYDIATLGEQ